jgi:hypothetical protein
MTGAAVRAPFSWWKFGRTFLGLLLAPVVGGTIGIVLFALPDLFAGSAEVGELIGLTAFGAYFGAFFGIIPALLVGWPVHLLLLRQRWTPIWVYVGLGALIGMLALPLSGAVLEALS